MLAGGLALCAAELAARQGWLGRQVAALADGIDPATRECATPSLTRVYSVVDRCAHDADGLRIDPVRARGRPGAARVLLVGDSIGEQAWSGLVADRLTATLGRPVEVWNAALSGYGVCQEAAVAREVVATVDPDVVLVQTCPNDATGSPVVLPDEPGWVRVRVGEGERRFPSVLLASSLVRAGLTAQLGFGGLRPVPDEVFGRCVRDLAGAVGDRPLRVVHFPYLVTGAPPGSPEEVRVQQAWAFAPALDLRPVLSAHAPLESLRAGPDDHVHPGAASQALLADLIAPFVATVWAPAP